VSLHMHENNGVSTNMGIIYVTPVQNKAVIHFMVNLSDHEVHCHNNKNGYYDGTVTDAYQRI
jgi:N-acetylmuramoyl-L-alanine amidase CwlA